MWLTDAALDKTVIENNSCKLYSYFTYFTLKGLYYYVLFEDTNDQEIKQLVMVKCLQDAEKNSNPNRGIPRLLYCNGNELWFTS